MNAPEERKLVALDSEEQERHAVLAQFKVENIQRLNRDDLLAVKILAGRGNEWGRWITPESQMRGSRQMYQNINLANRLRDFLAKEEVANSSVDVLIDEGVLALTRVALLMKLVATGGRAGEAKPLRLKASSLASYLYSVLPKITARALSRKASNPAVEGLFQYLTESDVLEFKAVKRTRIEIERLHTLVARGVWSDAPPLPDIRQTTNPSTQPLLRAPKEKPDPYQPLPDAWLAEIGPRVLWVVEEMGPNLLRLLEALCEDLEDINWSLSTTGISDQLKVCIHSHLERHPWLSCSGKPLLPPFPLITATGIKGTDCLEWPPRTWEHVITLSLTLQTAHLFITLLSCAGRIGEVSTLRRDCIEIGCDMKSYLKGFTYKLSRDLFGDARTWPAPTILLQSLGQQGRLAAAWDWLPEKMGSGLPQDPRFGVGLWVSLGMGGKKAKGPGFVFNPALQNFARRVDMNQMPGGKNVHAHRFRKTVGRLAGVALFNSPLVLKRLFGHKSFEMTLHYVLCDPGVREDAEKVLRELRIMHCAEALEEIHQALINGVPLPGNGGAGAARLITTVRNEEDHLKQAGRLWGEGAAYDLACLLTMQGQGWRLIKENIVCSKAPGEDGLCQKKRSKGQPNTANCQPQCDNRIVFARKRHDVEVIIEQYLDIARQARDDGQLLVLASVMDNAQAEWANFSDLEQKYCADQEVQALRALCEEPEVVAEAA